MENMFYQIGLIKEIEKEKEKEGFKKICEF